MQALIDSLLKFAKIGSLGLGISKGSAILHIKNSSMSNETCVCNSHSQIQIPENISVHLAIQHVNALTNLMAIGQQGRSPGSLLSKPMARNIRPQIPQIQAFVESTHVSYCIM